MVEEPLKKKGKIYILLQNLKITSIEICLQVLIIYLISTHKFELTFLEGLTQSSDKISKLEIPYLTAATNNIIIFE